jgi:hypothetical protein
MDNEHFTVGILTRPIVFLLRGGKVFEKLPDASANEPDGRCYQEKKGNDCDRERHFGALLDVSGYELSEAKANAMSLQPQFFASGDQPLVLRAMGRLFGGVARLPLKVVQDSHASEHEEAPIGCMGGEND